MSLSQIKTDDPVVTPGFTTGTITTKSAAKDTKMFAFSALSPAVSATIDATAKSC
ncbi:hypothetical protein GO730_26060 [Spirosoma sp. HMF3257]|uniref:hypothetical protein n=1 Tax=Spirosoma telluris TaxID=2183553 RepID=UPI0012F9E1C6|nr:hypothetical protein [Spirosoma telluris]